MTTVVGIAIGVSVATTAVTFWVAHLELWLQDGTDGDDLRASFRLPSKLTTIAMAQLRCDGRKDLDNQQKTLLYVTLDDNNSS